MVALAAGPAPVALLEGMERSLLEPEGMHLAVVEQIARAREMRAEALV